MFWLYFLLINDKIKILERITQQKQMNKTLIFLISCRILKNITIILKII